jgi:hypothetical protein
MHLPPSGPSIQATKSGRSQGLKPDGKNFSAIKYLMIAACLSFLQPVKSLGFKGTVIQIETEMKN